ncbi:M50 family metallopeptidase [Sulfuricurvum kujiense]|uniref:M50 family metallopeptidase n=1 Tax=Sulfuricurvum kujiense TaxID=148813 RepID=UPI0005A11665|nr:M50 family metallopeptidase [Sulfuricurvum kujiense]
MQIIINSREYECWHEAGHAVVCLLHGGKVELMEIIQDKDHVGRARARCETTNSTRPKIACGGFAAEYYLYETGAIDVTEKEFVQSALVNAFPDKKQFFGADYEQSNGCWPTEMDIRFRDYAIYQIAPLLKNNHGLLKELANTLFEKEIIYEDEIQTIKENYIK